MSDNHDIRAILDHYWEATAARDIDRSHKIYHDDVVVEFPQSGERISGKHNIYELRAHYPAKLSFKALRVLGEGNLWISEIVITYDGRPVNAVSICSSGMVRLHMKRITLVILSNRLSGDLSGSRECSYQCQSCRDILNASIKSS
ncbi:MAG: nuclear transport factor 2 family protein [Nitrososphaeraceae archaeon]